MARVLVVDDDEQVRHLLERVLTQAGFDVAQAADGDAALEMQRRDPADVVVADILLPGTDGVELITRLRDHAAAPRILAISGGGHVAAQIYLDAAKRFGADRVLAKPFDPAEVVRTVRELLAG